ncbi:MAG: helix-turn-helix transcriptional regulator [Sutterellaceae bacterium]|nr:helix-turn-helix transcriptional regulator [Sutterellaceae bacterium]
MTNPSFKPSLKSVIFSALEQSGISRVDLSQRLGLNRNAVTIWAMKGSKIPFAHLATLSSILGLDPVYIRNLALSELHPELFKDDERIRSLGEITKNESEFLEILRSSNKINPKMNEEQKEAFRKFVDSLDGDVRITDSIKSKPGRRKKKVAEEPQKESTSEE